MELDPGELVALPAGTVRLRDARRGIEAEVRLEPFQIARTTVVPHREDRPVHGVSWFDAASYCNDLSDAAGLEHAYTVEGRRVHWDVASDGFRLPTEAEWEYACRAGTTDAQYGQLADIAWTSLDEVDGVQGVGRKQPNGFGLSDMLGNVWEWCWDYLDPGRYADYRVFRGGGWADPPWSVRASVRRGSAPEAVLEGTGFRVARGATAQPGARAAQGWSAAADRARAGIRGPLPMGWTPLHELLDEEEPRVRTHPVRNTRCSTVREGVVGMQSSNADRDFGAYNIAQQSRPMRPLAKRAVEAWSAPGETSACVAVELGSGVGIEAEYLASAGFRVHSHDVDPGVEKPMQALAESHPIQHRTVRLEELAELPDADLILSCATLSFVPDEGFAELWQLMRDALRPGGALAVDLFGLRDDWAGTDGFLPQPHRARRPAGGPGRSRSRRARTRRSLLRRSEALAHVPSDRPTSLRSRPCREL